mmetsp:Transcript_48352/g.78554  ORF Transcript_48352/g.78554 Transcript_48352/m.78554 type:complete len:243 (+) Transcript_48352:64-792(+)
MDEIKDSPLVHYSKEVAQSGSSSYSAPHREALSQIPEFDGQLQQDIRELEFRYGVQLANVRSVIMPKPALILDNQVFHRGYTTTGMSHEQHVALNAREFRDARRWGRVDPWVYRTAHYACLVLSEQVILLTGEEAQQQVAGRRGKRGLHNKFVEKLATKVAQTCHGIDWHRHRVTNCIAATQFFFDLLLHYSKTSHAGYCGIPRFHPNEALLRQAAARTVCVLRTRLPSMPIINGFSVAVEE